MIPAFLAAVLGPDAVDAVAASFDPHHVAPYAARAWLAGVVDVDGYVPGTDVEACLRRLGGVWYGVVGGCDVRAATDDLAAAVVAATLGAEPGALTTREVAALSSALRRMVARAPGPAAVTVTVAPVPIGPVEDLFVALDPGPCPACSKPRLTAGWLRGCPCVAGLLATAHTARTLRGWQVRPSIEWGRAGVELFRRLLPP